MDRMTVIGSLLFLFVFLTGSFYSTEAVQLECPKGWVLKGYTCYKLFAQELSLADARTTCQSYGAKLVDIFGYENNLEVGSIAAGNAQYWIDSSAPYTEGFLSSPADGDAGECRSVLHDKKEYYRYAWTPTSCSLALPFVCETAGQVAGLFRCLNGRSVQMSATCDGENDCLDFSDELNCTSRCKTWHQSNTGDIAVSSPYKGKDCRWLIEGPPDTKILLEFDAISTERDRDEIEIWIGGRTDSTSTLIARLSGKDNPPAMKFRSTNNLMLLVLLSDGSIDEPGFNAKWVAESVVHNGGSSDLVATPDVQYLQSPHYPKSVLPSMRETWVITAGLRKVISLQVLDFDLAPDAYLLIRDGETPDGAVLQRVQGGDVGYPAIVVSPSSAVNVYLHTDKEYSGRGVRLSYIEGCGGSINATGGVIMSPGYPVVVYPSSQVCTWLLSEPQGKPLTIVINDLLLQDDGEDALLIYDGASAADGTLLHTLRGSTIPSASISSSTGKLAVVLKTSASYNNKGFDLSFASACIDPHFNNETVVDPALLPLSLDSVVSVSCKENYYFAQEEHKNSATVVMQCLTTGWNVFRLPDCQPKYCGQAELIENGYIDSSTGVRHGDTTTYSCYAGYQISQATIQCVGGQWEPKPTCSAAECDPLTPVANSAQEMLHGNGTDYGTVVKFTCDSGYELSGPPIIICRANGTWSNLDTKCNRKPCPLPVFANGNLSDASAVYEDVLTVQCNSGYEVNGPATVTCQANQTFDGQPACKDVDECKTNNGGCALNCTNTDGSFVCSCHEGYEISEVDNTKCIDIDECDMNNGSCDHICRNVDASYYCECKPGYVLYTADGVANMTGVGLWPGDKLHINHTCVRKLCPVVTSPSNGYLLSAATQFRFEDVVHYRCMDGYVLSGASTQSCLDTGAWSNAAPTCEVATCTVPDVASLSDEKRPTALVPATAGVVNVGDFVNLTCSTHQPAPFVIRRQCRYDPAGNAYTLGAVDTFACPVIDCGEKKVVSGGDFSNEQGGTFYGAKFNVDCRTDFTLIGTTAHPDGSNVVECDENGHWKYGNITCKGETCDDPGTPVGAEQIGDSYKDQAEVTYNCLRDGFALSDPTARVCESTTWNNTVVPECVDVTPPQFTNCPPDDIEIDQLTSANYALPVATDNTNFIKQVSVDPIGFRPDSVVKSTMTVTYTAYDAADNTATCVINIRVKDFVPPEITCPEPVTFMLSTNVSTPVNYPTVTATDNTGVTPNITYEPASLSAGPDDVGTSHVIVATATDADDNRAQCSFMISVKADKCQDFGLATPRNGHKACMRNAANDGLTCLLTCSDGYAFYENPEVLTRQFNCTDGNDWSPAERVPDCYGGEDTVRPDAFLGVRYVYHSTADIPIDGSCNEVYRAKLLAASDASQASWQGFCDGLLSLQGFQVEIASSADFLSVDTLSKDSVEILFNLRIRYTDLSLAHSCAVGFTAMIGYDMVPHVKELLKLSSNGANCPELTTESVDMHAQTPSIQCYNKNLKLYVDDIDKQKSSCLPCPLGMSLQNGTCADCPVGSYVSVAGEACQPCDSGKTTLLAGSRSADECVDECSRWHMTSATGLPPCKPCPKDQYANSSQVCVPCPTNTKTDGPGMWLESQCKPACPAGEYSRTGYEPCTQCPQHFYSINPKQTSCSEAPPTSETTAAGAINYVAVNCAADYCKNGGTCSVYVHRQYCTCAEGYTGDTCENQVTFCNAEPCYNGGTCSLTAGGYTCACLPGFSGNRCENDPDDCQGVTCQNGGKCRDLVSTYECICLPSFDGANCETKSDSCQKQPCLNSGTCRVLSSEQYECDCKEGFQGPECQVNIDDCASGPCRYGSNCTDGEDSFTCQCVPGVSSGPRCEIRDDSCSSNPCGDTGTCIVLADNVPLCLCKQGYAPAVSANNASWIEQISELSSDACVLVDHCANEPCVNGSCTSTLQGYTCTCAPGYNGDNCQHNIDECASNPCVHGTCTDDINKFVCTCEPEYDGEKCDQSKTYCNPNPCTGDGVDRSKYTGGCENIPGGKRCHCLDGFDGPICEHNIDDCASLPCMHGATCVDGRDEYTCQCADGWTGVWCEQISDNCQPDSCKNSAKCLSVFPGFFCQCKALTYGQQCELTAKTCRSGNPCVGAGSICTEVEGNASCLCSPEFSGVGCELAVQYCAGDGICENGGTCKEVLNGFKCLCPPGFVGERCENSTSMCEANSCQGAGVCVNSIDGYHCECPLNKEGPNCDKDIDTDYDLYFQNGDRSGRASSVLPFVLGGSSLSVGMWIRLSDADGGGTFFTLYGLNERSLNSPLIELVRLDAIQAVVAISGVSTPVPFEAYAQLDVAAAPSWNYVLLAWDGSRVTIRINSVLVASADVTAAQPLPAFGWVVLGCRYDPDTGRGLPDQGLHGLLSQVNVWRAAILADAHIQDLASRPSALPAADQLAVRWTGYLNHGGVEWLRPSTAAVACDAGFTGATCNINAAERAPLSITCPGPVHMTSSERLTTVTWSLPTVNGTGTLQFDYAPGAVFIWGRYTNVYTVTDEFGNMASCGFDIFVRPGDCVEPTVGAAMQKTCDAETWPFRSCVIECTGADKAFSVPVPERYTCGPQGSFNVHNMYLPLSVPECADKIKPRARLTISVVYRGIKPCETAKRSFKELIYKWLTALDAKWRAAGSTADKQLCGGRACEDAFAINIVCPQATKRRRRATDETSVVITSDDAPATLSTDTQTDIATLDILLASALDDQALNFSSIIPSGISINDLLTITSDASCLPGQQLVSGFCVDCALGTFYDEANSTCELCPIGSYGDTTNITACTPCDAGKTTKHTGSTASSACQESCAVGSYFDGAACVPCDYGFYQDEAGQFFCKPCSVNTNTSSTGTTNSSGCVEVCIDGMQIGPSLVCVNCSRGFYRRVSTDAECLACPNGNITRYERAVTVDECDLPNCQAGHYISGDHCEPCEVGFYQPVSLQYQCIQCSPATYTTLSTGAKNLTDCKFICPAGQEEDPDAPDTCRPCLVGYYKTNASADNCDKCSAGYTTLGTGSMAAENCSIWVCSKGHEPNVNQDDCVPCARGTYQPLDAQPSCLDCPDNTWTKDVGSVSQDLCVAFCPDGQEGDSVTSSCTDCNIGYYRNATLSPFDPCELCPIDFITVATAAVSVADCTRRNCSAGTYRNVATNECVECAVGWYQEKAWETLCVQCPVDKTTAGNGSMSKDECKVHCPPGKEDVNDVCEPCAVGSYKSAAGPDACTPCDTGFITIDTGSISKDNCSIADCAAGHYRNVTDNTCYPCPLGEYQSMPRQDSCKPCPNDASGQQMTTLDVGQIDDAKCIPYCKDGWGYNATSGECAPCERGYYRKRGSETQCTMCENGMITPTTETILAALCTVPNCTAGYYQDSMTTCAPCPRGEYQPDKWQKACKACDPDTSTPEEGSTSADDCKRNCLSGFELVGDQCIECARGYYKDATKHFYCEMCDPSKITPSTGSTSVSECTQGNCTAGQRMTAGGGCENCPDGSYSATKWQETCVACGDKMATGMTGATSADQCYSTDKCSLAENPCVKHEDGGSCTNVQAAPGYVCGCRDGWIPKGDLCVNICDTDFCQNGATCDKSNADQPKCICADGYEGENCAARIREKSKVPYYIGGSIAGFVVLVLVLLLIIGLCWFCRIPSSPKPQVPPFMNPAYAPVPVLKKPPVRHTGTPPPSMYMPANAAQLPAANSVSGYGYSNSKYKIFEEVDDTPVKSIRSPTFDNRGFVYEDKISAMNIS